MKFLREQCPCEERFIEFAVGRLKKKISIKKCQLHTWGGERAPFGMASENLLSIKFDDLHESGGINLMGWKNSGDAILAKYNESPSRSQLVPTYSADHYIFSSMEFLMNFIKLRHLHDLGLVPEDYVFFDEVDLETAVTLDFLYHYLSEIDAQPYFLSFALPVLHLILPLEKGATDEHSLADSRVWTHFCGKSHLLASLCMVSRPVSDIGVYVRRQFATVIIHQFLEHDEKNLFHLVQAATNAFLKYANPIGDAREDEESDTSRSSEEEVEGWTREIKKGADLVLRTINRSHLRCLIEFYAEQLHQKNLLEGEVLMDLVNFDVGLLALEHIKKLGIKIPNYIERETGYHILMHASKRGIASLVLFLIKNFDCDCSETGKEARGETETLRAQQVETERIFDAALELFLFDGIWNENLTSREFAVCTAQLLMRAKTLPWRRYDYYAAETANVRIEEFWTYLMQQKNVCELIIVKHQNIIQWIQHQFPSRIFPLLTRSISKKLLHEKSEFQQILKTAQETAAKNKKAIKKPSSNAAPPPASMSLETRNKIIEQSLTFLVTSVHQFLIENGMISSAFDFTASPINFLISSIDFFPSLSETKIDQLKYLLGAFFDALNYYFDVIGFEFAASKNYNFVQKLLFFPDNYKFLTLLKKFAYNFTLEETEFCNSQSCSHCSQPCNCDPNKKISFADIAARTHQIPTLIFLLSNSLSLHQTPVSLRLMADLLRETDESNRQKIIDAVIKYMEANNRNIEVGMNENEIFDEILEILCQRDECENLMNIVKLMSRKCDVSLIKNFQLLMNAPQMLDFLMENNYFTQDQGKKISALKFGSIFDDLKKNLPSIKILLSRSPDVFDEDILMNRDFVETALSSQSEPSRPSHSTASPKEEFFIYLMETGSFRADYLMILFYSFVFHQKFLAEHVLRQRREECEPFLLQSLSVEDLETVNKFAEQNFFPRCKWREVGDDVSSEERQRDSEIKEEKESGENFVGIEENSSEKEEDRGEEVMEDKEEREDIEVEEEGGEEREDVNEGGEERKERKRKYFLPRYFEQGVKLSFLPIFFEDVDLSHVLSSEFMMRDLYFPPLSPAAEIDDNTEESANVANDLLEEEAESEAQEAEGDVAAETADDGGESMTETAKDANEAENLEKTGEREDANLAIDANNGEKFAIEEEKTPIDYFKQLRPYYQNEFEKIRAQIITENH